MTRGIANNNPGNIRRSADPWQGLSDAQPDSSFFAFKTPAWGIRAMAVLLIGYQDRRGINTPTRIIERWAPSNENDTSAYIGSVCAHAGFAADQVLNLHAYADLRPLVEAIIYRENGKQPYSSAVIDEGLKLAGVTPPVKSIVRDPAVAASTTAVAASTGAAQVATNISDVWGSLANINPMLPHYLVIGLSVVAVIACGYFLFEKIRSRSLA